jgi:hypothetical protein
VSVTSTDDRSSAASDQPPADAARPSVLGWQEQLRTSQGFRAIALQTQVKRMGYILQGNVGQYRSLVATLQDPSVSLPILADGNRHAHDDLLSEAERLLHNVLTAMSTRVDQQRHFINKQFADDPVLTSEYRERIASSFTPSAEAAFLKDLRNYITHRQIPVAQSKHTFGPESYEITFILPSEPLLTWDGWNGAVRKWIIGRGEAVPIVDVVGTYARVAGDFDKWLYGRIGQKYETEIGAFRREQKCAHAASTVFRR